MLRASRRLEKPVPSEPWARLAPWLTFRGRPLRNAPPPLLAWNVSSCEGSWITPASATPSRTTAITTVHAAIAFTKLAVPSIGSITQV